MPMLDAYIPEGALSPSAERELLAKLTDPVDRARGGRPQQRDGAKARLGLRPPPSGVRGWRPVKGAALPLHLPGPRRPVQRRASCRGDRGDDTGRGRGAWRHPELRVCVFTCEVPDGWWGGAGRILRLADIYELAGPNKPGMNGQPREAAARVLAAHRRQHAEELLAAVGR